MRRALIVFVLILCSSCGNAQRLSLPTFVTKANEICNDANVQIKDIKSPDPTSDGAVADAINQLLSIQKMETQKLGALRPPTAIASEVQEWIQQLHQVLDQVQKVEAATRQGDDAAAQAADRAASGPNKAADKIAKKLKLTKCLTSS